MHVYAHRFLSYSTLFFRFFWNGHRPKFTQAQHRIPHQLIACCQILFLISLSLHYKLASTGNFSGSILVANYTYSDGIQSILTNGPTIQSFRPYTFNPLANAIPIQIEHNLCYDYNTKFAPKHQLSPNAFFQIILCITIAIEMAGHCTFLFIDPDAKIAIHIQCEEIFIETYNDVGSMLCVCM